MNEHNKDKKMLKKTNPPQFISVEGNAVLLNEIAPHLVLELLVSLINFSCNLHFHIIFISYTKRSVSSLIKADEILVIRQN